MSKTKIEAQRDDSESSREGEDSQEHLENASDSFSDGISGLVSGIEELYYWYIDRLRNGYIVPTLTTLALGPVLTAIGAGIGRVVRLTWGSSVTIGRDIILLNLPVPLSLTIYFLLSIVIVNYIVTYLKISELQTQVAELETRQNQESS